MPDAPDLPLRVLPKLTPQNEHFWTGGADGELRFLRCGDCAQYVHPPSPVCPGCLTKNLAPAAVSGRATLATFTINHHPWAPGPELPWIVAIVEIEEQPSVRLMTNLVNCEPDEVRIGMPLRVVFEARDDVWIPLFEPDRRPAGDAA